MDFEDLNHRKFISVEEHKTLDAIFKSIQLINGHCKIVPPWRHQQSLPNNRKLVTSRLNSLRNRFIREQKLHKEYDNVMTQYVELGHAEKATENCIKY
ncbi:uncharacterized protein Smp_200580 [Schistosoma mansoni]|uniref:uncharacterized protein n=1 Tax=Schistosoma mansoni TaxID=6183 RepID=UPI00022DC078|nr:uncharacterized protein Smp_200580 [Schistosoma mansoni]|eukprot:XP_018647805.1 uncharacterized protein Smp_200580 [Schistosoma mansoni]